MARSKATLWLVGVPLHDSEPLSPSAQKALSGATLWIGESRRRTDWVLKQAQLTPSMDDVFFLDPFPPTQEKALRSRLRLEAERGGNVALFSDTGMPVLFDPGSWILTACRELKYEIRSASGPCSWSTACVISGYEPPFWIEGFLPRETEVRKSRLQSLLSTRGHLVLMDTPYRFTKLIEECVTTVPKDRELFLAWEIGGKDERFFWGTAKELQQFASNEKLTKGEFILLVRYA